MSCPAEGRSVALGGHVTSGLADNPDTIINDLVNNLFRFFAHKNVITVDQRDNRVRSLLYTLDQIGVQVKFRMVDPGQFDHIRKNAFKRSLTVAIMLIKRTAAVITPPVTLHPQAFLHHLKFDEDLIRFHCLPLIDQHLGNDTVHW